MIRHIMEERMEQHKKWRDEKGTIRHHERKRIDIDRLPDGKGWVVTTLYMPEGGSIYDWKTESEVFLSTVEALTKARELMER